MLVNWIKDRIKERNRIDMLANKIKMNQWTDENLTD